MNEENKIILYQDDNEITRVSVRFANEDLWLTQNQLAEIYCTTQENISMHISNIFSDKELDENRTYKKFLLVRQEGNRQVKRNIDHYNLDMIRTAASPMPCSRSRNIWKITPLPPQGSMAPGLSRRN